MTLILQLLGWKCKHRNTGRPRHDEQGRYIRCTDCGERLVYNKVAFPAA